VSPVDARHRDLLRVLTDHGVDFVLVGGVALQVHGFSGATLDVDVTISIDESNGARIAAALEHLHAAPHLAGERGSAYRTDLGQLEVMRSTDGVGDYDNWMRNAVAIELDPASSFASEVHQISWPPRRPLDARRICKHSRKSAPSCCAPAPCTSWTYADPSSSSRARLRQTRGHTNCWARCPPIAGRAASGTTAPN
jgi:hypothetical protein